MDAFRQPVHYYEDGIVPFGLRQLSNSVNGDDLPTVAWDLVGHKLPHLLCQEGFAVVAGVTLCHVAGNIVGDAWPPVIVGDQLQCLPLPWVASHHGVMVGMDNVMVELLSISEVGKVLMVHEDLKLLHCAFKEVAPLV